MRIIYGTATFIFSSIALAATPIDGWYTSIYGGYTDIPNHIYATYDGITRSHAMYHSGYDVGGAIGYKSNPMRYEGEITYLTATLNKFRANGATQTGVTGYADSVLALANVYYDFQPVIQPLQPYLGVGFGYGWLDNRFNSTGPFGATYLKVTNNVFAYQGTAGLAFHFAENYSLGIAYRYVRTTNISGLGDVFQANIANASATYRFDGSNYK